jgi:hypothetical protein
VTTEDRLRAALAEFTAAVHPRPALHLIRIRTASASPARPAEAADQHPRKD